MKRSREDCEKRSQCENSRCRGLRADWGELGSLLSRERSRGTWNRSRGRRDRIGPVHSSDKSEAGSNVRIGLSSRKASKAIFKHSTSLPSATEQIAMKIPTPGNAAESGISSNTDDGSNCLSRRNLIFGGAAAVAAISMPKNSLASTPLSTATSL